MSNPIRKSWQRFAASVPFGLADSVKPLDAAAVLSVTELKLLSSMPGALAVFGADSDPIWLNENARCLFSNGLSADDLNTMVVTCDISASPRLSCLISKVANNGDELDCVLHLSDNEPYYSSSNLLIQLSRYCTSDINLSQPLVLATFTELRSAEPVQANTDHDQPVNNEQYKTMAKLLSITSHEMRTPLNAIIGFSEMLEGKAGRILDAEKKAEYATLITKSARHMLDLTSDLLEVSKLRSGGLQLKTEDVDLKQLTDETVTAFNPEFSKKNISIAVNSDEYLPIVQADGRAVRQVMFNLLSNAVKFSDEGGEIAIELSRSLKTLEWSISDSGAGISETALASLGSEYFREENENSPEGNGLGLSIVYQLIEKMSGKVSVESTRGKGSKFKVTLPIVSKGAKPVPHDPHGDIVYLKPKQLKRDESAALPMADAT